jgi:hypothetical protein
MYHCNDVSATPCGDWANDFRSRYVDIIRWLLR